jgi:hypothetical protein
VASLRVQLEWRDRIAAEYTSAAITHNLVHWLIQLGAPPDLIAAGLAIVGDELAHSRASHEVYVAAGGDSVPAIDASKLALVRDELDLHLDALRVVVRVFCLGETVAVPLFVHLRSRCTEPVAREALDRIVRDEARHRDFGWDLLDWLQQASPIGDQVARLVTGALPAMLADLERSYGDDNPVVHGDDGAMSDADRAWGLAPAREYAEVLAQTRERDFRPRFEARGIAFP